MVYYNWKSYKLKVEPVHVFEILKGGRNCFFLDSSLSRNQSGRYSFLGIDPFHILNTKDEDSFKRLKQLLSNYKFTLPKNNIPFLGGAVGFLSYDLGFHLEKKLRRLIPDDLDIPDCFFGFYNTAIIIDNAKRIIHIFAVGFPEKKYHLGKALCESNIKKIEKLLKDAQAHKIRSRVETLNREFPKLKSNFSQKDYLLAVREAKKYIKAGDIYQVNLSQRFETQTRISAVEIYKRLRKLSPSHFSAYFDAGDFQILSSSPERFLRLESKIASTSPMKGTRSRGKTLKEDMQLRKELINSKKENAELTMIVDLERNDLGRVCEYGSIRVNSLRQVEEYSTVFQTTATVSGQLHKDKDRIDLLRACFPGGSITGCPKIRSMEIIEKLEPNRRNIYTGCLGYLSFSGGMDFNILIRTILKKKDKAYFSVGAGIVADSDPESEYQETLTKAKAMISAIRDTQ